MKTQTRRVFLGLTFSGAAIALLTKNPALTHTKSHPKILLYSKRQYADFLRAPRGCPSACIQCECVVRLPRLVEAGFITRKDGRAFCAVCGLQVLEGELLDFVAGSHPLQGNSVYIRCECALSVPKDVNPLVLRDDGAFCAVCGLEGEIAPSTATQDAKRFYFTKRRTTENGAEIM